VTFTDLSIQQLHEKIAAGEIFKPGDTVTIATADGEQHAVTVFAVRADSVVGKEAVRPASDESGLEDDQGTAFKAINIPIADIQTVEKVHVSHPAGQAAIVSSYGVAYIFGLMLPAAIAAAWAL
jgi:hypothetical protein